MKEPRDHFRVKAREEALDYRGLRFVLWLSLAVLALAWYNLPGQPDPANRACASRVAFLIDLNRADCATLTLIPGIGPRLAEGILEERAQKGAFDELADLDRVKGLGPVRIRAMEKWVFIGQREIDPIQSKKEDL
ncbi:MAG: ComEA family DNA-binding protein [Planctomycetota bacterium]|jgi:predicted DNA-binding helix-hairpin-helix protein